MICNVQCLPEPGTCKSKLIAAKPSFEEPVFQILGVPGQGAVSEEMVNIWKKMEVIQENDTTEPDMTAIPLKFLYPRPAF